MRCPKCRYIGFEDNDQCRNCGYDFSLSRTEAPLDLPIRAGEPLGPMADLRLRASDRQRNSSAALTPPPDLEAETGTRRSVTPGLDLPLFNDGRDDVPLVDGSAAPRMPLAVRRAAPVTPRVRIEAPVHEEPGLDFPEVTAPAQQTRPDVPVAAGVVETGVLASAGARFGGAAVDALIIGAIDAAVLYFTLEICGLQFGDVRALPVVPLLSFLLILNGGYLTMFTAAGGQTIGKMAARTRVVPAAPADPQRLRFSTAVVRAAACFVSILPAGAGFLMALFRADGRALHDAVADTRVIRA
jgi:uncharacterized RDD family membrane protein YckC